MENRIEKRALEMKKTIYKVFEKQLKDALAERDRTEQRIESHKLQLELYKNRVRDIEAAIEERRKELPDLLAKGEDPGQISKKMSELKSEFAEVSEWIEALETHVLPPESLRLAQNQQTVQDISLSGVRQLREQYTADLNEKALDLEADILGWDKMCRNMIGELKIVPFSRFLYRLNIKNRTINDHTESRA
ncbi:MAG: hypothetical protein JRC90_04745 [Deltaproteobacteria bacterium]|nr:hypothetical protein [Deltaproteobacteria bacterium]